MIIRLVDDDVQSYNFYFTEVQSILTLCRLTLAVQIFTDVD